MKKLLAMLICACLIFSFASCKPEEEKEKSVEIGATDDEANYPQPESESVSEFESETGMCLNMTLDQFTTAFNDMYLRLGGKLGDFPYKKWKKRSETTQNGLDYIYYYMKSGDITLTATVERNTLYIINLGCGVSVEYFGASKNGKQRVLTISGIMAAVAGGYKSDYVNFFDNLFVDAVERDDGCFWYNNWIYLYEETKQTRLFRIMPATSDIAAEWNIEDYKNYWKKQEK